MKGADSWRSTVQDARLELAETLQHLAGVAVEEKGLAVAVHWRNAPDRSWAQSQVQAGVEPLAARLGLHVEPGKLVEELRAPLQMDKGIALRWLIEEFNLDYVAYLGDDRGDLPAFTAVTKAGGVAVVVHTPETAPEVAAVPGLTLNGAQEVRTFLQALATALDER